MKRAFGNSLLVGGEVVVKRNPRFISGLVLSTMLLVFGVFSRSLPGQQQPINDEKEPAITRKDVSGFTIIGIEARTNNAKESTADGVIPKQWQKFFSEGIPAHIPNKSGPEFYAVYCDYASDHHGDYTYVVGAQVKEGTTPPSGMVLKRVPPGQYAVFTTDKGPFAEVVPAAWQKIFQLEEQGKIKRKYQTDFEIYDQRAQDPQDAQVDIYIGVQ